jgi:hypothetical protein
VGGRGGGPGNLDNGVVRTRLALAGAWILGTVATSGLAWAAVNRVETRITTNDHSIVSPRSVDQAVAPLAVSSTTALRPDVVASSDTTTTVVTTPATTTGTIPNPSSLAPIAGPGPSTTTPPTIAVARPTVAVPTTTAPPPAPSTTTNTPMVTSTPGGSVAVTCPTANTIRLEYATPNPGWVFAPVEVTPEHLHLEFSKSGQSIKIEVECSHGKAETSVEDDD